MSDALPESSAAANNLRSHLRELVRYDDARDSAPYEHTGTLLVSGALVMCALRAPSRVGSLLHALVAGALIFRAASGRDGLRRWAGPPSARSASAEGHIRGTGATDGRTSGPVATSPESLGSAGF